jgi:hypothetical protein
MSLNWRGWGSPRQFKKSVASYSNIASLVFLSETCCFSDSVERLRRELGLPFGVGVGCYGRGGGLVLLWTNEVCVKLQSYDKLHIDVMIVDQLSGAEFWRFTGFYGESRRE